MTLQSALNDQKEKWLAQVSPEVRKLVADDIDSLQSIARGAIGEGALFPLMPLPNHVGGTTELSTLVAASPLIVTFYRGGWCPYCNLELRAYQQMLPQIEAAGGRLVAISPESPDNALTTSEKQGLGFEVLSDTAGRLAKSLGIHYRLAAGVQALYEKFGIDLPARHDEEEWALPLPATYVVEKGGRIALAHAEPDFFTRLEPAVALAKLEELARRES